MDKNAFQQFRRSQIAELRPFVPGEDLGLANSIPAVSISEVDLANGSPKLGDMIARNPANHDDQWLIAAKYFADNFEPLERVASDTGSPLDDVEFVPVKSEETSSRVASKAAVILGMKEFNATSDVSAADYNDLLHDAKIVAGSALTQVRNRENANG